MNKQISRFILFWVSFNMIFLGAFSQDEKPVLYNPEIDATVQIRSAIALAAESQKHVLLQVGGNWCSWCYKFHYYCKENEALDSLIEANFEVVHINYSRENENKDILAGLGYPQRFGFPVFVILDGEGKQLHIQDSGYLENGKGYDMEKVTRFFQNWSAKAIDPGNY